MIRSEDGEQTIGFGIGNSKRGLIACLSLLEGDFDLIHFIIIELTEPTSSSMHQLLFRPLPTSFLAIVIEKSAKCLPHGGVPIKRVFR